MSLELLQDAVRHYMESGGKIGPDHKYTPDMEKYYHDEYERTYRALDGIFKKTGKMGAIRRAAEFLQKDAAKARGLGGKEAVSGDAGADAVIVFCIEKLKIKFPGLRMGK